jgi:hypothetical protein
VHQARGDLERSRQRARRRDRPSAHPIGASGARVLVTLLYAMAERKAKRGIATLRLGGGEVVALLVEQP